MSLRSLSNALFGVVWTAGSSSLAIGAHYLTQDQKMVGHATALWARVLAKRWSMPVRVEGAEHLLEAQPCVIMSNHLSYADIVALFAALPLHPKFIAKRELRKVPFLGKLMQCGGHIFIDRTQRKQAIKAMAIAAAELRKGESILIFPEGTRGEGRSIGVLHSGGFRLAKQAGVAIVPVGIRGTERVLPRRGLSVQGAEVSVRIGAAIPASSVKSQTTQELMELVRDRFCELSGLPPAPPNPDHAGETLGA
mgnify:CR=1 FL=1